MDRLNNSSASILATILYEDIFAYPLTRKELWKYLHVHHKLTKQDFGKILHDSRKIIGYRNGYFFLKGKEDIAIRREKLKSTNQKKQKIAQSAAKLLAFLPTICLIGISGSVAMQNGEENDDIDLFFITKKHTLWLTRLFITIILDMKKMRRKKYESNVANKVCVNMLLTEDNLVFSNHTIYIAHEIAQLVPIVDKGKYYQKLLNQNMWIQEFLYNIPRRKYKQSFSIPWTLLFVPFEFCAAIIQKKYMVKDIKNEILTKNILAFHPVSYEKQVLAKYMKRRKKYGI